jgi:hypothetical protein
VKREVAGRIDRTVADSTSLRARRVAGNARKAAGTKVEKAAKKARSDSAAAKVKSMGSGLKKKFGF